MTTFLRNNALDLPELASAPAAPDAGRHKIYFGDDGYLYAVDAAGTAVRLQPTSDQAAALAAYQAALATAETGEALLKTAEGVAFGATAGGMVNGALQEVYYGDEQEGVVVDLTPFGTNIKSACVIVVARDVIQDLQVEFRLENMDYVIDFDGDGMQQFIVPVSNNVFQLSTVAGATFRVSVHLQAFWQ